MDWLPVVKELRALLELVVFSLEIKVLSQTAKT